MARLDGNDAVTSVATFSEEARALRRYIKRASVEPFMLDEAGGVGLHKAQSLYSPPRHRGGLCAPSGSWHHCGCL